MQRNNFWSLSLLSLGSLVGGLALGAACEHHESIHEDEVAAVEELHESAGEFFESGEPGEPEGHPPIAIDPDKKQKPDRVAPDAKRKFEQLTELIESDYVDGPLTEDELYTAAIDGVMHRLIQLPEHEINALLSPQDLDHLMSGTKGSIVGVGIMIEMIADSLVIKGTVPGGPAEQSELQAGDRILAVDGKKIKGMPLADVVDMIRGEEGSNVELFVQREADEWTVNVERSVVQVASVESKMLDETIGYVRVNGFSKTTVTDLDAQLAALKEAGMTGLVLDVRNNPGGLLDAAIETADRFLPAGKRVVTIRGRKGEEHKDATETNPWEEIPLVVITGPKTASGAEILASALDEHQRAAIVGERTMGKGTVEAIHDLDGGWALKLSFARFFSPNGEPRHQNGVEPDFEIPTQKEVAKRPLEQVEVTGDPALRAAVQLLAR
jgi:carboxyl-terminal processing protease